MINIAIVGTGGVVGYFGYKLITASRQRNNIAVDLIVRGETAKALKENGLTLITPEHPTAPLMPSRVITDNELTHSYDVVFICVKDYSLQNVVERLMPVIREDTTVVPLMNGVDICQQIRASLKHGIVMPSCVYVASHQKAKGVIEHIGKPGKIICGKDPAHPDADYSVIPRLFENTGVSVELKDDATPEIWNKFIFICSFGLVTTRHNASFGEVLASDAMKKEAVSIITLVASVARQSGVAISDTIAETVLSVAARFPPETRSSLRLDFERSSHNELDMFVRPILKRAHRHDIDDSAITGVYDELLQRKRYAAQENEQMR
jgi:2-dehydropantoate 2-reductase